ncbi:hypothetical protein [Breoghania sp.]|uniref:hypothetical protein n=1 Tax=Breoghania sp. TaxID=2065378 RepID=UPI0026051796|nr:hypothetical protein [Breoghania sp.]MDJ0932144.1 hypothetical protein [Breoghania sp.]
MERKPLAPRPADAETTAYVSAVRAYGLWGFLPLYFMLVSAVPSIQLVAQRIVWSVVIVGRLSCSCAAWTW